MAEKTYSAFFSPASGEMVGLIDWEGDGKSSAERVDGAWVPLEEWSYDSLDGMEIATMSEEIVEIFDKAEEENRSLVRSELTDYLIKNKQDRAVTAAAEGSCPPATQDIALNLKNRKNAIDTAMYGPLNPEEPNEDYWQVLADEWGVDAESAKKQRCGNCAVFIVTPSMKECISSGLAAVNPDEFDAIDTAGELGYCEAFDFKCASARTCRAWVAGGPITEDSAK